MAARSLDRTVYESWAASEYVPYWAQRISAASGPTGEATALSWELQHSLCAACWACIPFSSPREC